MTTAFHAKLKKIWPLFMDGVLKAKEPLRGGSLLFTTKFPGVPGTHLHLIKLGRVNG